jgi:CHASE2 domain-containing sensor protein
VYGATPPLGVKGEKLAIAVPTVKLCAVVVAVALITGVAATTVKLTVLVVLATTALASITEKTTLAAVYGAVGIPVTVPLLVFKLNPAGRAPDET